MQRRINKDMSITEKIKIIHDMMGNMNSIDRRIMSDNLISYLLFDEKAKLKKPESEDEIIKSVNNSGLSEEENKLISDLAKRTEELKNLLGEDPAYFM